MVLQSSGAISLGNIQTEFGGTNPISISEYYAKAINIPLSGTIRFSDFYGGFAIAGRGVFGSGMTQLTPTAINNNVIEYVTISTTGNATDFGDLSLSLRGSASCSSTTRGLIAGGVQITPVVYNATISYVTIATAGNASNFGNLSTAGREDVAGCSSPTRGVFAGGFIFPALPAGTTLNTMDYVTIATLGNAIDFGDLPTVRRMTDSACSSSTRGVFFGGFDIDGTGAVNVTYNTIDYITIATTGNTTNFGTISNNHDGQTAACSSPSRGVFGGGTFVATAADAPLTLGLNYYGPTTAEYVTIATTGNSSNFGNLHTFVANGSSTSNSIRGIFAGGQSVFPTSPTVFLQSNVIEYVTISTTGNATDFGDLSVGRMDLSAFSDSDGGIVSSGGGGGGGGGSGRGVFGGGVLFPGPVLTEYSNVVDYITIATTGNATDFGDLTLARSSPSGCSSSTRGVFGGGGNNPANPASPVNTVHNIIDYITIATTGNATDFGDLTQARLSVSGCSSPTRGIFGGGNSSSPSFLNYNIIDYITIETTGNATDFGDLLSAGAGVGAFSSPTRGVFGSRGASPLTLNTIEYVTIATTGNATDFGDLTVERAGLSGCSSSTRGVFAGGSANLPGTTYFNTIDYVTIATTGNATDFGDLIASRSGSGGCSSPTRGVFGGGVVQIPLIINYNTIEYITIATTGNTTDFGDLTVSRATAACSDSHGGLA